MAGTLRDLFPGNHRLRSLRMDPTQWRDWWGATIVAVNTPNVTVRVWLGASLAPLRTIALADLPSNAALGHPLAVQLNTLNPDPSSFSILNVVAGAWGPDRGTGTDASRVNDGSRPIIPKRITNMPDEYEWTSGHVGDDKR